MIVLANTSPAYNQYVMYTLWLMWLLFRSLNTNTTGWHHPDTIWRRTKFKLCNFYFLLYWILKSIEVLEQHDKIIRLYVPFARSPAAYSSKTGWWEKTDTCWRYGQQVASCLTMKQIEKNNTIKNITRNKLYTARQ